MKTKKDIALFMIRVILLFLIIFGILFVTDKVLFYKYNRNNTEGWSWSDETNKTNQIIADKFYERGSDLFPIMLDKTTKIEPKNNKKRILVIGDSYVWGYSNPNINNLYWKQLYQKFREEGYNDIEIYAAGLGGFSTEDEYNYILCNEKLMKEVDPDLIIITYVPNDPEPKNEDGIPIYFETAWGGAQRKKILEKLFPNLYQEIKNRVTYGITDNLYVLKIAGKYFNYRWDAYRDLITSGKNLDRYEQVLIKVDHKMQELNVPYFYYYQDNAILATQILNINNRVTDLMKKNNIPFYNHLSGAGEYVGKLMNKGIINSDSLKVNPVDSHPSHVLTSYYANDVYDILKSDYDFIFPNKKSVNLELNINDSSPVLDITKVRDHYYKIIYPEIDNVQSYESKYLYLPLNQDYVKLNLEFPMYIKEIKLYSSDATNLDLQLNIIDRETGLDLNSITQQFYEPKKIGENTWSVNEKVSSINLMADFNSNSNREIYLEIIE